MKNKLLKVYGKKKELCESLEMKRKFYLLFLK